MGRRKVSLKAFVAYEDVKRPIQWSNEFNSTAPLDIEIGFGNGDFLVRIAQDNPERCFVGFEQIWERVFKTLRKLEQDNVQNVKVLLVDVYVALERLFDVATIENVYCLFPCPWPKKTHIKHRLFSTDFLKLLNSRLTATGKVQIVTDYFPYKEWILEQLQGTGFEVATQEITPQFNTKYEKKWLSQGQNEFYEIQLRKVDHQPIPVKEDVKLKSFVLDEFNPAEFRFHDQKGDVTIVQKDFLYDDKRKKALVYLIVNEQKLTQHIWVDVTFTRGKWRIHISDGHKFIPTAGVAQAIHLVYQSCQQNSEIVI